MSTEDPHKPGWSERSTSGSPLRVRVPGFQFLGNTLRKRITRGGGLAVLAVLGTGYLHYNHEAGNMNDALSSASSKAAAVIDRERLSNSQAKRAGARCINGLVRLKPGAVVRSSPRVIEDKTVLGVLPLHGNRVSLFSGNEGLPLIRPRWERNNEGQWISFHPDQAIPTGKAVNKVASSEDIQKHLDYVQIPQNSQGQMIPESSTVEIVQPQPGAAAVKDCLWDASGGIISKSGDEVAFGAVISNSADYETVVRALSASGLTMPGVKVK